MLTDDLRVRAIVFPVVDGSDRPKSLSPETKAVGRAHARHEWRDTSRRRKVLYQAMLLQKIHCGDARVSHKQAGAWELHMEIDDGRWSKAAVQPQYGLLRSI